MHFYMVSFKRMSTWLNPQVLLIPNSLLTFASFTYLFMILSKTQGLGTTSFFSNWCFFIHLLSWRCGCSPIGLCRWHCTHMKLHLLHWFICSSPWQCLLHKRPRPTSLFSWCSSASRQYWHLALPIPVYSWHPHQGWYASLQTSQYSYGNQCEAVKRWQLRLRRPESLQIDCWCSSISHPYKTRHIFCGE